MHEKQPPSRTAARRSRLPVVFLGPSLSLGAARQILKADYRPPIRRGDLGGIPAGSIVAIVDGVFDQALAVSTTEIRSALDRGIRVLGASSMGALRAVEVPGVYGAGRIYEMYRSGAIESDDEVAICFDPTTLSPLCEPLINVRHAVESLANPGTISRALAASIVGAARRLPYPERTYPRILKAAGLNNGYQTAHLIRMLQSHDLKREDTVTLLEQLRSFKFTPANKVSSRAAAGWNAVAPVAGPSETTSVHCWEF